MARCNFCILQDIKRVAAQRDANAEVAVVDRPTRLAPDGVSVFVWYPGDKEPTWAAWLARLPGECRC